MMKDKLYISKATRVHYEDPLALPSSILFKVFLFLKHEDHVSAMSVCFCRLQEYFFPREGDLVCFPSWLPGRLLWVL